MTLEEKEALASTYGIVSDMKWSLSGRSLFPRKNNTAKKIRRAPGTCDPDLQSYPEQKLDSTVMDVSMILPFSIMKD